MRARHSSSNSASMSASSRLSSPFAPVVAIDVAPSEEDRNHCYQVYDCGYVGEPQSRVRVQGVSPENAVGQIRAEDPGQDVHAEWHAEYFEGQCHDEGEAHAGRLSLALLV